MNSELTELIVRADAGPRLGTGHVMRMIALAKGWSARGGSVTFVSTSLPGGLRTRLDEAGFERLELRAAYPAKVDIEAMVRLLEAHPQPTIAVDGPHFAPAYWDQVQKHAAPLLLVDDMAQHADYAVDVLLNQNAHAHEVSYRTRSDTRRLLGTDFVLMRQEFRARGLAGPIPSRAHRILVSFGGADPENVTARTVEALAELDSGLEVVVVVGAANGRIAEIRKLVAARLATGRVEYDVRDLSILMAWADLAVSSGGTAIWELACMGVPTIVVETGPSEVFLTRGLRKLELFDVIGDAAGVTREAIRTAVERRLGDANWRMQMRDRGRSVVDGLGVDRVIATLTETREAAWTS